MKPLHIAKPGNGQLVWALLIGGALVTPVTAQHGGRMGGMGPGHSGGMGVFSHFGGMGGYSGHMLGPIGHGYTGHYGYPGHNAYGGYYGRGLAFPSHSYGLGAGQGSYSHRYGGWPSHFSMGMHSRYYPHGGWLTSSHYYYYPYIGFGLHGLYSWSYGGSYPSPYPYTHYMPWYSGYGDSAFGYGSGWDAGYRRGQDDARQSSRIASREAPAIVELRIEPMEAVLYLDGNSIGTAEHFTRHKADLRLPAGRYYLEAALNGYAPLGEFVELKPGQTFRLERRLERSSTPGPDYSALGKAHPETPGRPQGRLVLSVLPGHARVLLDSRFICFGEMVADNRFLHQIPAGPHTLEVSLEGYRAVREEIVISPLRPLARDILLAR